MVFRVIFTVALSIALVITAGSEASASANAAASAESSGRGSFASASANSSASVDSNGHASADASSSSSASSNDGSAHASAGASASASSGASGGSDEGGGSTTPAVETPSSQPYPGKYCALTGETCTNSIGKFYSPYLRCCGGHRCVPKGSYRGEDISVCKPCLTTRSVCSYTGTPCCNLDESCVPQIGENYQWTPICQAPRQTPVQ
jgi:hypothetical protein